MTGTWPSGTRASTSRPSLEPGDLLAERYRLLRAVSPGSAGSADAGPTVLWQATDEVLARPVAVKILPAGGRAGAAAAVPFLAAAGQASTLSHPGLARVYDAALEERPTQRAGRSIDVAYVISEWVEGRTLSDLLLADGPLEPVDAVRLAQDAAAALGSAHQCGVGHGRVHPGNLLITPAGRLRVTDACVAAAVHGSPLPSLEPGEPLGGPEIARDTRDLAAVLYAMLTGSWPAGSTPLPSAGLPAAPTPGHDAMYAPRQVRAGVPRALDAVVVRALDPARVPGRQPIATARELAQALDEAGPDLRSSTSPPPVPRQRRSWPGWRYVPKLAALALIIIVALTTYTLGKKVGELPRKTGAIDALVEPAATPAASAGRPGSSRIDLAAKPVLVRDYDPYGSDGREQPGSVPNAYDGDPSTTWMTDGYASPTFGGLKPGVGLLVDLGSPTVLANVQVGLATPGATVELRSSNQLGDNADAFAVVDQRADAPQVTTLTPTNAQPARYWLIWFTRLTRSKDGRYRGGVAELVFNRGPG